MRLASVDLERSLLLTDSTQWQGQTLTRFSEPEYAIEYDPATQLVTIATKTGKSKSVHVSKTACMDVWQAPKPVSAVTSECGPQALSSPHVNLERRTDASKQFERGPSGLDYLNGKSDEEVREVVGAVYRTGPGGTGTAAAKPALKKKKSPPLSLLDTPSEVHGATEHAGVTDSSIVTDFIASMDTEDEKH